MRGGGALLGAALAAACVGDDRPGAADAGRRDSGGPPRPCGDGTCGEGENACTCRADCAPSCGDGCCSRDEACLQDCPQTPPCDFDGECGAGEDTCSCQSDCGTMCGDDCCAMSESRETCPADCTGCGDGTCSVALETACDCPEDCFVTCGDSCCSEGEPKTCPGDCRPPDGGSDGDVPDAGRIDAGG